MPQAYGILTLIPMGTPDERAHSDAKARRLILRARHAMQLGMFVEWLEAFMAGWEETHDVDLAGGGALIEWDMGHPELPAED